MGGMTSFFCQDLCKEPQSMMLHPCRNRRQCQWANSGLICTTNSNLCLFRSRSLQMGVVEWRSAPPESISAAFYVRLRMNMSLNLNLALFSCVWPRFAYILLCKLGLNHGSDFSGDLQWQMSTIPWLLPCIYVASI